MRTTSLLNVGPLFGSGSGGRTTRCRAATNAKTRAAARATRRMESVRQNAAIVNDSPADDGHEAVHVRHRDWQGHEQVIGEDGQIANLSPNNEALVLRLLRIRRPGRVRGD